MNDEAFMKIALEEARKNVAEGLFPVGAAVVLNGEVIGKSKKMGHGHLSHAEIVAMKEAFGEKSLTKDDHIILYTTVEPCLMCYGTIFHTQIKKVLFALEDPWAGGTHIKPPILPLRYHEVTVEFIGGVLREESRLLVKEYAQNSKNNFWEDKNNPLVAIVMR